MSRGSGRWLAISVACALAACQPATAPKTAAEPAFLAEASFADLPGWPDDALNEVLPALKLQCRRFGLLPADTALGGHGLAQAYGGRAGQWSEICAAAEALPPDADAHGFFTRWFQPYRVTGQGLITGYYEPALQGARHQGGIYQTPVLARPDDLASGTAVDEQGRPVLGRLQNGVLTPYPARSEIMAGALGAHSRALVWLASPVDLFFAQVQGAALVRLSDGGLVRLAFDGRNGRPYTPIGRVLVQQGALRQDQVSLQTIRAWLDGHPDLAPAIMNRNESYVFFRFAGDANAGFGPPGALGVYLTPGRSAAVDKRYLPLGAPVFVATSLADGRVWRHLVLGQDLGSAITGPARVDLFFGTGEPAAAWAGPLHQPGDVWVLLPRLPGGAGA